MHALDREGQMTSTELTVDPQPAARAALARGDAERAVALLESAMATGPTRLSLVHDLVRALLQAGRIDDAVVTMQRLVLAAPHRAELHLQLIRMLHSAGRDDEARAAAQVGCGAHRGNPELWSSLETLARTTGRWQVACDAGRRLVELVPGDAEAWRRLALAARHSGDDALMSDALDGWIAAAPQNPAARHLHAAHHGHPLVRADAGYITALFDSYADRFDEHLADLGYRAPELVVMRVTELLAGPVEAAADLGCGTGQVGTILRPWADRLVGVDLSSGMLGKARDRGQYDELVEGELTAFLLERSNAFDLVVSADTLVYIGDLRPVFRAAASALRHEGVLAFTIETRPSADLGSGYALDRSGRYVHEPRWIAEQLASCGFHEIHHHPCVLRFEERQEVHGAVFTALTTRPD